MGKSTFFNALTLLDVPIAPYPFTTLKPNRGVAAVRTPCPHREKGTPCTPGNARCIDGTRWVPVNLIDVPGLVPGAHEGKGLGHQFLDDLRAADGFLQVIDASGGTTAEGVLTTAGSVNATAEVQWLEEELVHWIAGILSRDFERTARSVELEGKKVEEFLSTRLTGLSISAPQLINALRTSGIDREHPSRWSAADRLRIARSLLRTAKPTLVAGNKCDKISLEQIEQLRTELSPIPLRATAAENELTLRRAARAGLVRYSPGDSEFTIVEAARLNTAQSAALSEIAGFMRRWQTTGVQQALEQMVFERLHQIVVFPVEDETRWTDSRGRILPDAFLVPQGTPVRAVAFRVHSELGENFVRAIDGRTHRAMGAEHPLEANSVVRIVAHK